VKSAATAVSHRGARVLTAAVMVSCEGLDRPGAGLSLRPRKQRRAIDTPARNLARSFTPVRNAPAVDGSFCAIAWA
jgi:hypothetical protein